ncbi:LOW QUALITY PROTEIN: Pkinase_Tyr domain-containing protein, partial [Cephalotus follicularis]
LSNNELSGPLPIGIGKMLSYVTTLDISWNNFSGEIPSSIGNLSYLNVLKLDHNMLTGLIPLQLQGLSRLKTFSVSHNLLSGPVPYFLDALMKPESYASNKGLCGPSLHPCKKNGMKFDESFQAGFVIGYVGSFVSALTVFVFYCLPWLHVKKRKILKVRPIVTRKKSKRIVVEQVGNLPTVDDLEEDSKQVTPLSLLLCCDINLADLCKVTDNFGQQNIMGSGQMGTLYKGTLPNGCLLAVKKMHDSEHLEKQFISETDLGRLKHVNIAPLLGFCIAPNQRLLVYKYMSNGSLYDWLHAEAQKAKILEWPLRVKIAIGVAKGLAWLHHSCNFHVVHLNISSKCILLDRNFEPKLSNFGRSMLMNPNSNTSSWSFSADNKFWDWGFIKKDVSSFGTVLLELIMGKEFSEVTSDSKSLDGSLEKRTNHLLDSSSGLYDDIDKYLVGKGFDGDIFQFLRIACNCVQPFPDRRPTMLEVYEMLRTVG